MAERQISIDDLMRITKLPRYAVVKGVGLRAYTIALERASEEERALLQVEGPYIKPVEQAIEEIYRGKVEIELVER